jgi:hypothetical protein
MGNPINNLNFLIILLDKDFIACYKLKSFNTKEVGDRYIMLFHKEHAVKTKKEDGMKKLVIVAIAVLLALPVLSNAAPVENKYSMTIGGFIQMHMGWADQTVGSSFNKNTPYRSNGSREVLENEFGNLFAEGQSRLNFIVKGPDAWGAKTLARLEFDFTTVPAGESLGLANFRHSYMQFDWAQDSLIIGNTWYTYNGATAPGGGLTFQSLPNIMIPSRTPQIRWTHRFGKTGLETNAALEYPGMGRWMNTTNNYSDRYTMSNYPNAVLNVTYASDLCGKIGPERLKFGMSGVYGREKVTRVTNTGAALRGNVYSAKENDGWIFAAYGYVPIIPEKNMNKAGALGIQGGYVVGQGLSNYSSGAFIGTYARNTSGLGFTEDFSTPRGYGYYAALTVYAHDKLHFDLMYSDTVADGSNRWASRIASQTTVKRTSLYNLAMMYEPNPAILMGVEYTRLFAKYAQIGYNGVQIGAAKQDGELNAIRFFAQYSF